MNVPAHIAARQKRDLVGAALGGISSGSPPHISIADNRFTLVDDAGNKKVNQTLYLDVCVIDANASVSRIYFDPRVPFVPGGDNNNPPLCWSDNGIGASSMASQPQNTSCQLCPQAAWNSAVSKQTGKGIPACSSVKKIAVVVPGIEMAFLLRIPPASLKAWGKYCQTLAGHGVDLPDAITRIEFESQGVMKFTPMGYVDEASAMFTDKVLEAKATDLLVGRNDRPWNGAADAAKVAYANQAALAPPLQQTAPVAPAPAPMAPPPQPFGAPPAAAAPFGAPPSPTPGPVANDPFAQSAAPANQSPFGGMSGGASPAATAAPMETPSKPRKPRAPKAEAAPPADDGIPPFLQRGADNAPPAMPQAPPPNTFGMEPSPAAPDAGIAAALDAAFRLPT
jgi:hypothetical protein